MRITDLMIKQTMIMNLRAENKEAAIDELIASLTAHGRINDPAAFKDAILRREEESSTGIGGGIAMPHAKTKAVNEPTVVFAKSEKGVDFEALDGEPAHLFFMIAAPEGAANTHLRTLAALSRLLIDSDFISRLMAAQTPDAVAALFDEEQAKQEAAKEAEKLGERERERKPEAGSASSAVIEGGKTTAEQSGSPEDFVIAVTACPTGIAHTFMAEDALKKKAKEMGVAIRVETNGSEGANNVLTDDEIRRAKGVIIAADKNVEMARFVGKPVLQRPVSDGIRKPEELIRKALNGDAPVYRHQGSAQANSGSGEKAGIGSGIYKNLMNGISHMLPFVVGGGILLAISFLIEQVAGFLAGYVVILLRKVFAGLPKTLDGLKPILLYPIFGLLIAGTVMYYVFDPIFSWINEGLIDVLNNLGTGNRVLLGLILGGMMSIDMGGPFNKAAYAFAIGVFTSSGNTNGAMMAAVMAGGMVPPLAIALATTFFKRKFTEQERKSGVTNYVLGLSFITEGAIPFAASDPLRVLTSCILGSAIAGGLTQLWNINVPAPHGGIFVAALANHALLFMLAVLIGAVVSGLILGIWKKTLETKA